MKRTMAALVLSMAAVGVPAALQAQAAGGGTASAPTALPSTSAMKPETLVYAVRVGGNPLGTSTAALKQEGSVWVGSIDASLQAVTQRTEVRFGKDFAPISSSLRMSGAVDISGDIEVASGRVTGSLNLPAQLGGQKRVDLPIRAGAILAGTEAYVLAQSNLTPGKVVTIPVVSAQEGRVNDVTFTVAGRESVTVPAGTFPALKVEMTGGPLAATLYVREAAPHITVKQEVPAQGILVELQEIR